MKIWAAHRWAVVALFLLFTDSVYSYDLDSTDYCSSHNYSYPWTYSGSENDIWLCSSTIAYRFVKYENLNTSVTEVCYSSTSIPGSSGYNLNCSLENEPVSDAFHVCEEGYNQQCYINNGDNTYITSSACETGTIRDESLNCVTDPNYISDGLIDALDYTGSSQDIEKLDLCDSATFIDRRNNSLCGDDLYCKTSTATVRKFEVNECVNTGIGDAPYEYDPNKLYTHLANMRYLAPAAAGYQAAGCHSSEFENISKTCQHNQTLECLDANNNLFLGACLQEYQAVTNPATGETTAQLMSDGAGTPLTYDGSLDQNGSPDGLSTYQLNVTQPTPINDTGFQIASGSSSGGSSGGGYDNTGSGGGYGGGYTVSGGGESETINDGTGDNQDDGSGISGNLKPLIGMAGGQFGSEADQALLAAQDELTNTIAQVKSEFNSIFSGSVTSGTAQLPSWNLGTVKNIEVVVDWGQWHSGLYSVGNAILALAALAAFKIIFS